MGKYPDPEEECERSRHFLQTPHGKLNNRLRARIRQAFHQQGAMKSPSSSPCALLGCRARDWWKYLGKPSNDDLARLVADHIIPLSLYDLSDPAEQRKAFNYRNTQLMSRKEHLSKRAELPETYELYELRALWPKNFQPPPIMAIPIYNLTGS